MQNDVILCECNAVEHQIIITHDKEDGHVYINIHLNNYGFLKRLIKGIKYIFGIKSKHGHFEEIILSKAHVQKIEKILNTLKQE